jgi:hypothetical protein
VLVEFHSLTEESFLERPPFRVGRDLHKRLVDWSFERALLGEIWSSVGGQSMTRREFIAIPSASASTRTSGTRGQSEVTLPTDELIFCW